MTVVLTVGLVDFCWRRLLLQRQREIMLTGESNEMSLVMPLRWPHEHHRPRWAALCL